MKLSVFSLAIAALLFASCGPSKKLQNANAQIATLNTQVVGLNSQITVQQKTIAADDQQIKQLKTENAQYGKEAESCRKAKEALAQRMDNLNKALAENGTSMEEVKHKASLALDYFHDAGFAVKYEHGLIHISMPDKSMFSSGSIKISDNGRQAISVVADVLNDYPNIKATVIGNTDSVKINGSGPGKDNWSLSTERANSIIRVLVKTYHVDPSKLTAAGKSKFSPVADNATAEGRALNRRSEIILDPQFYKLWELTENK